MTREDKILTYLNILEGMNILEYETINPVAKQLRVYIKDKKIDLWLKNLKFTLVGSNKYNEGFTDFKEMINRFIDKN